MIASQTSAARRNILAGAIGSVLEWYDFAVYGYLAPIIGKLFFPADDPVASLLAAFGVFAIGFAARPVGGAIFGHIGDKFGRKPVLHRGAGPARDGGQAPVVSARAQPRVVSTAPGSDSPDGSAPCLVLPSMKIGANRKDQDR